MEAKAELLSSLDEAQLFLNSRIWRDLRGELTSWIDMLHVDLEGQSSVDEIRWIQGRIQAIREVMVLPQRLCEEIQRETRRSEGTNGRE